MPTAAATVKGSSHRVRKGHIESQRGISPAPAKYLSSALLCAPCSLLHSINAGRSIHSMTHAPLSRSFSRQMMPPFLNLRTGFSTDALIK